MRPKHLLAAAFGVAATAAFAQADDPYLWLEDINGASALAQVKQWNAATEAAADPSARLTRHIASARSQILNDQPDRHAGRGHGRQGRQPLGRCRITRAGCGGSRRSPLTSAGKPQWRTLIDVDALGKAEGKSWVWHGADCLRARLSALPRLAEPGGSDADVVREFDIATGRFVAGGFALPEAKNNVAWVDRDTLLVGDRLRRGDG